VEWWERMNWTELEKKYILQTYKRNSIVLVRGKGKYLWDEQGRRYLDFFSGLGVNLFGHAHPRITKVIKEQTDNLIHTCNLYYTVPQILLAKKLVQLSFPGKVFFSNSGAEANECAIKLARRWGKSVRSVKSKVQRYEIIVFENSFHGRTLATLSATGQKKFHRGFKPLLSGFKYAKFNDLDSVKRLVNRKTCAIMVELIQGEGGVNVARKEFVQGLKRIAQGHHLLLIFDEIQTGLGRTGKLFAYENYGVKPDILTLAKGLAGGLPLGATIGNERVADLFTYGDHGSTFGGNLVACSVSLEILKMLTPKILSHVDEMGKYFLKKLKDLQKKYNFIKDVRGMGLMLGIELDFPGEKIVNKCLERGLLINCTQEKVLRFLPPLFITEKDVNWGVNILEQSFSKL